MYDDEKKKKTKNAMKEQRQEAQNKIANVRGDSVNDATNAVNARIHEVAERIREMRLTGVRVEVVPEKQKNATDTPVRQAAGRAEAGTER